MTIETMLKRLGAMEQTVNTLNILTNGVAAGKLVNTLRTDFLEIIPEAEALRAALQAVKVHPSNFVITDTGPDDNRTKRIVVWGFGVEKAEAIEALLTN